MSSSESNDGTAQIGVTGLAVMGSNVARNFARHGYTVALHNRTLARTDKLLKEHGAEGNFVRTETVGEPRPETPNPAVTRDPPSEAPADDLTLPFLTPPTRAERGEFVSTGATPSKRAPVRFGPMWWR